MSDPEFPNFFPKVLARPFALFPDLSIPAQAREVSVGDQCIATDAAHAGTIVECVYDAAAPGGTNKRYQMLVAASAGGNVTIPGTLTVAGLSNLNGGIALPAGQGVTGAGALSVTAPGPVMVQSTAAGGMTALAAVGAGSQTVVQADGFVTVTSIANDVVINAPAGHAIRLQNAGADIAAVSSTGETIAAGKVIQGAGTLVLQGTGSVTLAAQGAGVGAKFTALGAGSSILIEANGNATVQSDTGSANLTSSSSNVNLDAGGNVNINAVGGIIAANQITTFAKEINLGSFLVAALPPVAPEGAVAYAIDGRKVNELAAGTGVPCYFAKGSAADPPLGSVWRVFSTDAPVVGP